MAGKKVPGRKVVHFRCKPWFYELIAAAAKLDGDLDLSQFIRHTLTERMRRLGLDVRGPDGSAEPANPRGKPS